MKVKVQFWLLLSLGLMFFHSSSNASTLYSTKTDTLSLPDSIYLQTNQCNIPLSLCLGEDIDPFNLNVEINGQPYAGPIENCQEDTIYIYTVFNLYGFGDLKYGPYFLDNWEVNGQKFTGEFQDINELVVMMNNWDPSGNWTFDINTLLLTGGLSGTNYTEMEITVLSLGGAKSKIGLNLGFIASGAKLELPTGVYSIKINEKDSILTDSVYINYACVKPSVVNESIVCGYKDTICLDISELTGPIQTITNICPGSSGKEVEFTVLPNNCIMYEGLKVGIDTFCAVICDVNGICDTTTLIVNVEPNLFVNLIVMNLYELQDSLYCFDTGYVQGIPISITNVCPGSSDGDVDFFINSVDFCVQVTALSVGSDTACYLICTDQGDCDTFKVIVNVKPLPKPDTIYLDVNKNQTIKYCLDLSELNNPFTNITNICPGKSGDNASLKLDFNKACIDIKGIKENGQDTACYVVCDGQNICDTFIIIINVKDIPPGPQIVDITVEYNEIDTYCIDTSALLGNPVSITNICPNLSGTNADVAPDPQTYCVYALGILPGIDTACIVVCTDAGICDTTIIYYHVIPKAGQQTVHIDVVEGNTILYCIDSALVCSPIASVQNICPDKLLDNSSVQLNPTSLCFEVKGLKAGGQDTLCLAVCCGFGNCDTVNVIINVVPPKSVKVFDVTVEEGKFIEYCFNPNDYCSPILSITNLCPNASNDNAQFNLDSTSLCTIIDGLLAGGADSLCLEINCGKQIDTLILIAHVVPPSVKQIFTTDIKVGEKEEYCFDKTKICSPIISIKNICPGANGENAEIVFDTITLCAQLTGTKIGIDSLCLEVDCGSGLDTIILLVNVLPNPKNEVVDVTVEVGEILEYCFDKNKLCSPILSVTNICPGSSGDNATIVLDSITLCAKITGLIPDGADSLCLVVNCGQVSDTISLVVHVTPHSNKKIVEVTVEKGKKIKYCFTDAGICSPIQIIENLCPNTVYDNALVSFNEFTACAEITGVNPVGTDTLCFSFCCGNGVCDTVTLLIHVIEKTSVPKIINLTIDVTDTIKYCLDLSNLDGPAVTIKNICPLQSGTFTQTTFDTLTNCFTFVGIQATGQDIFCIVACDSTGFCDSTIIFVNVIPKIITPSKVELTVYEGAKIKYCLDTTEIGSTIVSIKNLCPDAINDNVTYTYDSNTHCFEFYGFKAFGTDTACIVICGSNGFCDTTTIIVHVVKDAYPDTLHFQVPEGGSLKYCFDPNEIGGEIASIVNICPQKSGDNAAYFYVSSDTCVTIVGIQAGGPDTACFVICNSVGYCDTVILITDVYKATENVVYDTILLNFKDSLCFDVTGFDLSTLTISNNCPGLSGENVDFTINGTTVCVYYTGIALGTDTACITIKDANNNSLVTTIVVTVIPPSPDLIVDQIAVDSVNIYCLDLSELAGTLVSITNICPDNSNGNISFTTDITTGCINVTGLTEGTDTLCLVYCDNLGACDTTIVIINVTKNNEFPIANDDAVTTNPEKSVIINVLGNDVNPGGAGTVSILPVSLGGVGPKNGTATLNQDGSITYTPDPGFCGVDSFSYLLCIGINCDTAVVTINIECSDSLIIYNGFTPNGDGSNDVFVIKGIQNYPQSKLSIFNRWGNRVYKIDNYQNNWDGTWENKILPDGTYFYILDDGKGKVYSGYLQIYR